jgi:hypothetical protein
MKPLLIANSRHCLAIGSFAWVVFGITLVVGNGPGSQLIASPPDLATGLNAFKDVASVLRSPRCINCHPAGDVPRQTDSQLPHFPAVARGADGHGITGMRCSACHQETNQTNGIPGAPHWGLAPRSMAWAGLNDHELAEQLKDSKRNGSRTLAQMIEHVTSEPLVCWAWQPGGDREAPLLTHEQFIKRFKEWVAAGAPSPQSPKE